MDYDAQYALLRIIPWVLKLYCKRGCCYPFGATRIYSASLSDADGHESWSRVAAVLEDMLILQRLPTRYWSSKKQATYSLQKCVSRRLTRHEPKLTRFVIIMVDKLCTNLD